MGLFSPTVKTRRKRAKPVWKQKTYKEIRIVNISKFWSNVGNCGSKGECWFWLGKPGSSGYGRFHEWLGYDEEGYKRTRPVDAHVYAFELKNGLIAKGYHVCHKCNNKLCVNPEHMYAGSPKENSEDYQICKKISEKFDKDFIAQLERDFNKEMSNEKSCS